MEKIDLDAPAFGSNATKAEDTSEKAPAEISQITKEEEKKEPVTPSTEDGVPEQKVPYSRFQTVHQRAVEAEQYAREANAKLTEVLSRSQPRNDYHESDSSEYKGSLPAYWVKMYGDNPNSREAFTYELQRQNQIKEEARREAVQAVRYEKQYEANAISQNENIIDQRLDLLSSYVGRDITPNEENALLDIVDEYTPKGRDGSYLGDTIPFDKAWEILQMKQSSASSSTRQSRNRATSATSSRSEGEPTGGDIETKNKDFNPLDWNSWKKRIPN